MIETHIPPNIIKDCVRTNYSGLILSICTRYGSVLGYMSGYDEFVEIGVLCQLIKFTKLFSTI